MQRETRGASDELTVRPLRGRGMEEKAGGRMGAFGAARCRTPGSGGYGWREIMENIGVFACFPRFRGLAGEPPAHRHPIRLPPAFFYVCRGLYTNVLNAECHIP